MDKDVQLVYIPTELPFCIPPLLVGYSLCLPIVPDLQFVEYLLSAAVATEAPSCRRCWSTSATRRRKGSGLNLAMETSRKDKTNEQAKAALWRRKRKHFLFLLLFPLPSLVFAHVFSPCSDNMDAFLDRSSIPFTFRIEKILQFYVKKI